MTTDDTQPAETEFAPLIDVTGTSIRELVANGGDSALTRSMRRLVDSLDDADGVISAFSAFVS